jgi:hypothetical protein
VNNSSVLAAMTKICSIGNTDCLSSLVVDATGLLGQRFHLQTFTARLSFFTLWDIQRRIGQIELQVPLLDLSSAAINAGNKTLLKQNSTIPEGYHLFWDDIDKLKPTDFKSEVLFDLVDSLYRRRHGLTFTGNFYLRDLVEHERMHPAIVRRLDDMCKLVEV